MICHSQHHRERRMTMIRKLATSLVVLLASAAHAQQWVQLADPLAFDKPPPIWCNAQRSACAISWQSNGPDGALRVALTVDGAPDCQQRRPRYVYVRKNGKMDGDLRTVHAMQGNACIFDIPMSQIEGTQLLRISVPMLTQDSVVVELSLDGLDVDRLVKNRS
jgi:hypothetical protein